MKVLFFLFSSLLLASCVYTPDGLNFNNIEKPDSDTPIEVTLLNNSDSIYLYGYSNITLSIKSIDRNYRTAVVRYYDKEFRTNQTTYTFQIEPKQLDGWSDLSIDFFIESGNGSVADQLKAEYIKVTRTWKFKYIDLKTIGFHSGYRIHPDGYLQVFMVKPKHTQGITFEHSYPFSNVEKSEKGDSIFYALKKFVSGFDYFRIIAKNNRGELLHSETVNINIPEPTFEITQHLGDSCILSCTSSPIKCFYGLNRKIFEGEKAHWKIPYVFNDNYKSVQLALYGWGDYQGLEQIRLINVHLPMIGNQYYFKSCYSLEKDRFYMSTDATMPVLMSSTLPLPVGAEWAYKPQMLVACSQNGQYIIGHYNNKIYVFNKDLKSEIQLSADPLLHIRKYLNVTNDGVCTYQKGAEIVMKNLTGVGWDTFRFTSNADPNINVNYLSNIANTIDGKYVCVRGASDFKIYDVSTHTTATIIYENESLDYRAVIAHHTNPSLVYLKKATSIELRSLPDFNLLKTINLPFSNSAMHAIDPYTGIMVISSANYYYFIDTETGMIIYKLKSRWDVLSFKTTLNRNQFVSEARIIDLTHNLKK